MSTLKERLMSAPDFLEKKIKVADGSIEVTIRRITVRERDEILSYRKPDSEPNAQKGSEMACRFVAIGMADPVSTFEELQDIPAGIVEEIAAEIMNFNGWTEQGRRSLEDQFRTTAGAPV